MARLFELACCPELAIDFDNLKEEALSQGWTITGEENFDIRMGRDMHRILGIHIKFLCDHDYLDVAALAANAGYFWIEHTVLPINIYSDDRRFRDRRTAAEYYEETIPSIQLVVPRDGVPNGADVVWEQPLEATVPPLSGRELKERALQQGLASLTFLSGTPLEDEDSIVAPAIDREDAYRHPNWPGWMPECPGHVVFNCERAKKMRLRGKQSPENLYKPY